jgi:hypothetical protein
MSLSKSVPPVKSQIWHKSGSVFLGELLSEFYRRRVSEIALRFVYGRSIVCWYVCVSHCRMWCIKYAEGVTVLKRLEYTQPSKMESDHFTGLYTALSVKYLETFSFIATLHPQTPRQFAWQPSASLINLTAVQPQSHDCRCYVTRRTLAPLPVWLQKHADLHTHDFARSPDLSHQPRVANFTLPEPGDFVELILLYLLICVDSENEFTVGGTRRVINTNVSFVWR